MDSQRTRIIADKMQYQAGAVHVVATQDTRKARTFASYILHKAKKRRGPAMISLSKEKRYHEP